MSELLLKQKLIQLLGKEDFFIWEYYGNGIFSKIQAWIFRSRIKALLKLVRKSKPNPMIILDVGCGPMFVSYPLTRNSKCEYIGVDIIHVDKLKKYRDAIRNSGAQSIEVVRASAEQLPFRESIFDLVLSLDVLEHLEKPQKAIMQLCTLTRKNGIVAISLPLENFFQRLCRIGFTLMKATGDPILKKAKRVPITRKPEYHYAGSVKSYEDMIKWIKAFFSLLHTAYTPVGFHRSINVNAVHILRGK